MTEKPKLTVDMGSPDGNIFMIVINAGDLIPEDKGNEMFMKVKNVMHTGGNNKDALNVIGEYVKLEFIE